MHEVDTVELRKAMAEAHVNTIEDLSDRAGINRVTCSDVVNGRSYPSSQVMEKLKIALNLSPERTGAIFFKEKLA